MTILHFTGLQVTKYGSMEKYLLQMGKILNADTHIYQFENLPSSSQLISDINNAHAEIIIVNTSGGFSLFRLLPVFIFNKPRIIFFHFTPRKFMFWISIANKLFIRAKLIGFVHNVHHLNKTSKAKYVYNLLDHILAVSDAVRNDLINGGVDSQKIKTHYLGLLPDEQASRYEKYDLRARFKLSHDDLVIGNIAFDSEFKGIDVLIRALAQVVKTYPNVRLLQFGVNISKSKLKQLVSELNLEEHIVWAGIADHAAYYLPACDIYAQPSRYGEGLPLSIMEAMAQSLPVVATQVAGNAEAVLDNVTGLLCAPNDIESLANTLLRMIDQQDRWSFFGNKGHERYEELFDANKSISSLKSLV